MESLAGYGSEDENENERYGIHQPSAGAYGAAHGPSTRKEDDTNYDDVTMDMSENSEDESDAELPPAESDVSSRYTKQDCKSSGSRGDQNRSPQHNNRESDLDRHSSDRKDRRRDTPSKDRDRDRSHRSTRDRHSPQRDRYSRSEKKQSDNSQRRASQGGHSPVDQPNNVSSLPDLKTSDSNTQQRSQDARDAVSPRFLDRDRRDRDKDRDRDDKYRDRDKDRDRHGRRSNERSGHRYNDRERGRRRSKSRDRNERSRSRGAYPPPIELQGSGERRVSPSGDYRPSSYKVNKKLDVIEKMGLQIKTPDGSMATAQQLRQAASDKTPSSSTASSLLPSYYNPNAVNTTKIIDQVQKRKLLWAHKNKSEAEEAAKWQGTRFAQDSDGKQANKFMRLMGIKEAGATPTSPKETLDPVKKQEEMFQAMQAQYDVARATTHTMRGVGLGFQRGQY